RALLPRPLPSTLFPYTTLFRSEGRELEILSAYKKDLPASVFTEPYTNPTTDGSGNNRTNLRKAQQLLSEAGYKIVNGKLIDPATDRKSTRLNSSHVKISYAVFC